MLGYQLRKDNYLVLVGYQPIFEICAMIFDDVTVDRVFLGIRCITKRTMQSERFFGMFSIEMRFERSMLIELILTYLGKITKKMEFLNKMTK